MKKTILLLFTIVICLSSCQKEEIQLELNADFKATTIDRANDPIPEYTNQEILEINLRWTAFLASKVLKDNTAARSEVQGKLQNGKNSLTLINLFNNEESDFYHSFYTQLTIYIGNGHPEYGETRPNPPPITPPGSMSEEQKFLKYILNDNCVELYFPRGLNFFTSNELTSTGHPITNANNNQGVKLLQGNEPSNDPNTTNIYPNVNLNYVNNNNNIVIARPYRGFLNPNCGYAEYSNIDFTDFLDL